MMWRIMQMAEKSLRIHHNSSHHTKAEWLFCYSYKIFLSFNKVTSSKHYPISRHGVRIWTAVYSYIFLFCVFLQFFCSDLLRNSAISCSDRSLYRHFFRPPVLKQPPFQANIPSINLVSKQSCHRLDSILLASSNFGKRQLVIRN